MPMRRSDHLWICQYSRMLLPEATYMRQPGEITVAQLVQRRLIGRTAYHIVEYSINYPKEAYRKDTESQERPPICDSRI